MAISKRMRFEILRRDNHTCRYCGQTAPDVKLAVDHVLPTALGGTDEPNNLVTACTDCNSGKTSTSPDSELVADIDSHALLMQAAYAKAVEARNKKRSHVGKHVTTALTYWEDNANHYATPARDAKSSLRHFLRMGITPDDLEEAMDIALNKRDLTHGGRWRYFCGIVNNFIRELETEAKAIVAADTGTRQADPCQHCDECRADNADQCLLIREIAADEDRYACAWCGDERCLYDLGWQDGHSAGWQEAMERVARHSAPKEDSSHG